MLGLLAAMGAYNFVAPDLLEEWAPKSTVIVGLLLGALAGQPLLLAMWSVLGTWRFWRRWLASLAAAVCLYAVFLLGMAATGVASGSRQAFAVSLLYAPLVFLCTQFPLWLLRLALGRGLANEDDPPPPAERGVQFRTRDAFTAMALIGLSLGLARIAVLLHQVEERDTGIELWLGLAIACAAMGLWSAVILLPSVWAAFLARRRIAASVVVALVLLLLIACLATGLGLAFIPNGLAEFLKYWLSHHAGLLAVVLLGCQKIRSWGYTLQRER
jgi:hypothetical protein